jgi:glycosyltransferase involved in cell wall biosynthesis
VKSDTFTPTISVIVLALNEGERLRETVEALQITLPAGAEIVVVDDGSSDGCADFLLGSDVRLLHTHEFGTAKARNFGVRHAAGDILVFADAHIQLPEGWWRPMLELLRDPIIGAVASVVSDTTEPDCKGYGMRLRRDITIEWLPRRQETPYPVALIPWCCTAMRRDTFEASGGFDEGMIRWGGVDMEFSVRLWLLGYELWLIPQVEIFHFFREDRPYHVEWSWVIHNRLRLALVHFNRTRISRAVEALRDHEAFASALSLTVDRDIFSRRAELAAARVRDDEWFFSRFGPDW